VNHITLVCDFGHIRHTVEIEAVLDSRIEAGLRKNLMFATCLVRLGALLVLYEMMTGVLPFTGNSSAAVFDAILRQPPAPLLRFNPSLPAECEQALRNIAISLIGTAA
jgi:hypothetical protein